MSSNGENMCMIIHLPCSDLLCKHICSITASHDKSIRVWSTFTWECTAVIGHAHSGQSVHVEGYPCDNYTHASL